MTLIKSISGIRGTIGGKPGDGLTPLDTVKFVSAYAAWIKNKQPVSESLAVVVGRDARISGNMVSSIVNGTLMGMGINVIDLELSTTPTVEMAVPFFGAHGGIILTASHNPAQWNALKLINEKGEFVSESDGQEILSLAAEEDFNYADVHKLGEYRVENAMLEFHIKKILELPYVDTESILKAGLSIVVDPINSSGAIAVPMLLKALGVHKIKLIHAEPNGVFGHDPEPLPQHLLDLSSEVVNQKADLGISVDPDVDRLALVCENGDMFGEEYTLVAVADHVLAFNSGGNTVSNLSSTRALADITTKHNGSYQASAVGEVNVVSMMKQTKAVIGGEGNGGIIVPELHYGRDALAGIAIFLTQLTKSGLTASQLRKTFPDYFMSKNKIVLTSEINVDRVLFAIRERYREQPVNAIDGVKIEFNNEWVHLRKSNTEPVIRIYSEGTSPERADALAKKLIKDITDLINELKS